MDPVGISNISIQLSWKYGQTHVMVQGFSPKPLKGNGGLVNEYMSFTKTKFFLIPQICDYIIPRHPVILVIFSSGSNHLSMVLGSTILRRWASIPREFTRIPEPRQVDSRCIFVYVSFLGLLERKMLQKRLKNSAPKNIEVKIPHGFWISGKSTPLAWDFHCLNSWSIRFLNWLLTEVLSRMPFEICEMYWHVSYLNVRCLYETIPLIPWNTNSEWHSTEIPSFPTKTETWHGNLHCKTNLVNLLVESGMNVVA